MGAPLEGVTIDVYMQDEFDTVTDSQGNYTISGLREGLQYTLTPSHPDYSTFDPTSWSSGSYLDHDVSNVNFTAIEQYGRIHGRVAIAGTNIGLSGVLIAASGSKGTFTAFTTSPIGAYSLDVPEGTYTITPSKLDFDFTPENLPEVEVSGWIYGQDFTAQPVQQQYCSISGRVKDTSFNGVAGVTITLEGGNQNLQVFTDPNGFYRFDGLPQGNTYIITPTANGTAIGYTFDPPEIRLPNLMNDISNADFTAIPEVQNFNIHGMVFNSETWEGISNVTVTARGGYQATSDMNGNYVIENVPTGFYDISAQHPDYTFEPLFIYAEVTNGDAWVEYFLGTPSGDDNDPPPPDRFTVSGRVTHGITGAIPLSGAIVEVMHGDGQNSVFAEGTTDALGNYLIQHEYLVEGSYIQLRVSCSGYSPSESEVIWITCDVTRDFNLAPVNDNCSINGFVHSGGNGVSGVLINVTQNGSPVTQVFTNDMGYYFTGPLSSGFYTITASHPSDPYAYFNPYEYYDLQVTGHESAIDFEAYLSGE
jgi:hypothetical protein